MTRVLVVEPIHSDGIAALEAGGVTLEQLAPGCPDSELTEAVARAEAILVRVRQLSGAMLDGARALRIVSKHGVGCDNIDVAHCTGRGIPVAIAADANAVSVAEHTMLLMLAAARGLREQDHAARAADWGFRATGGGFELAGKTLLVVGLGRIGQRVVQLARAFGMRVLGHDPVAQAEDAEPVTLDAGLAEADLVTLHVPLTGTTAGLFDAARLAALRPGAVLINCARGGIVDEAALRLALAEGRIGYYGSDVFAEEPVPAEDPLLSTPRTVLTPHSAAMTPEAKRAMAVQAAENILACLDGRLEPRVVINRQELGL
ncbi:MAG: hydroxyacid dehydrogenase [Pseudomonadota bacterium]